MKNCLFCQKEIIVTNPKTHNYKYCNETCRNKHYPIRYKEYRAKYQRAKWGEYREGKKQCLLCEKWYIQVASHVMQRHHLTAQEYKQHFDLPLNSGVIPEWYRAKKAMIAKENGTAYILPEVGKKTRYIKGDLRAVMVTGWKGRNGNKGYVFRNQVTERGDKLTTISQVLGSTPYWLQAEDFD